MAAQEQCALTVWQDALVQEGPWPWQWMLAVMALSGLCLVLAHQLVKIKFSRGNPKELRPSTSSSSSRDDFKRVPAFVMSTGTQCKPEVVAKQSQAMVTYKRHWQKPEFRMLPEHAHG